MELGDKETVVICIQASVTCYLHVIHRYMRMVHSYHTLIWYAKLYHTRMVQNIGTKGMNIHDLFAVAVLKSDVIIGHIPRAISAACYVFLG